jgi:hypothetical protein
MVIYTYIFGKHFHKNGPGQPVTTRQKIDKVFVAYAKI